MAATALRILMVEDNDAEVELAREALSSLPWPTVLHAVSTGEAALDYLRSADGDGLTERPDVVWLDLKLPGMPGHDVLRAIRSDAELGTLPVIIFSSSASPDDVKQAYALHANCYVVKAMGFEAYLESVHAIVDFWGKRSLLPHRASAW